MKYDNQKKEKKGFKSVIPDLVIFLFIYFEKIGKS